MAVREGKWRCPYCSSANRGRDLACQGCGAKRDKDVSFFLEDDAPEVEDPDLLAQARAGADWLCPHCGASNRPEEARCRSCGVERGAAASRQERVLPLTGPVPPSSPAAARAPLSSAGRGRKRGCGLVVGLALLLVLGFCAVFGYIALRKTEEVVRVTGLEWERSIDVEALRAVRESAWEGAVPSGVRVVGRSREVHHTDRERTGTERVKVGVRDKGNGFFEDVYEDRPTYRDRPVYGLKVTYDVDRWVRDRTARAAGTGTSPAWPDPRLRAREREAGRREKYVVVLQGRRTYRKELPFARWSALRVGESFRAVVRGGSRVLELGPAP
jgi:hypothetical protein